MLDSPTIEKLKDMKLKVMAEILADPDNATRDLSFEDRIAMMVEKQWLSKRNARIKRLIRNATFAIDACIEDIKYLPDRTIDKKTVQTLA